MPDLFFRDGDDCPLLAALQPDVLASGVKLSVSARDEMVHLFHYGRGEAWDLALHLYLESGKKIWRTLREVLRWRFGDLARIEALLDCAAGYGRVTRFAALDLPPDRIWASEIDPEAVRFQEATFGVHGLLSTTDPAAFVPGSAGQRFDAILVSSLFTHLPETRFAAWLERLLALLRPGGLLAFSVHDVGLLPGEEKGTFVFRPQSESGSLAPQEYGSTWVTEERVRALIAEVGKNVPGLVVRRIPRGLANYQDLYVATSGGPQEAGALADLRGGAEGFIEACVLLASRRLAIGGWAIDRLTHRPLAALRLSLNGELAGTADLWDRPEIAAVFPGEAPGGQGFRVEVPLPRGKQPGEIEVRLEAAGADGFVVPLYAGSAEALLLRVALYQVLNLGRKTEALEKEIAGMKESRFWKLRDVWWSWKRRLT
jgi:SAM-dependent methyltransferase